MKMSEFSQEILDAIKDYSLKYEDVVVSITPNKITIIHDGQKVKIYRNHTTKVFRQPKPRQHFFAEVDKGEAYELSPTITDFLIRTKLGFFNSASFVGGAYSNIYSGAREYRHASLFARNDTVSSIAPRYFYVASEDLIFKVEDSQAYYWDGLDFVNPVSLYAFNKYIGASLIPNYRNIFNPTKPVFKPATSGYILMFENVGDDFPESRKDIKTPSE